MQASGGLFALRPPDYAQFPAQCCAGSFECGGGGCRCLSAGNERSGNLFARHACYQARDYFDKSLRAVNSGLLGRIDVGTHERGTPGMFKCRISHGRKRSVTHDYNSRRCELVPTSGP
mgnify:CR=1 FL=1